MQELIELINQTNDRLGRLNPELVRQLVRSDKFAVFTKEVSKHFPWIKIPVASVPKVMQIIKEVKYCIDHNIASQPRCKNCNTPVEFDQDNNRYPEYCCEVCEYQITVDNYQRLANMIKDRILLKTNNVYTLKQFKVQEFLSNPKNRTTVNEIIQKHFPWIGNLRYETVYELLHCLEDNITEQPTCPRCGKPLRFSQKLRKYVQCHKQIDQEDVVTEPDWSNVSDVRTYIDKTVRNRNGEYFWLFIDNFMEKHHDKIIKLIKNNYPWIDLTKDDRHIFWEFIHCVDNNITEPPECENCGGLPVFDYYKKEYKRWCKTCIKKLFLTKKEEKPIIFNSLSELWNYLLDKKGNISPSRIRKVLSNPETRESIKRLASEYKHIKITTFDLPQLYELLYCWKHNIKERPKCPVCGRELAYRGFNVGYGKVCSNKECQAKYTHSVRTNYNTWDKTKETLTQKYGSLENYFKHRRERSIVTCIEKYGVSHHMQNPEIAERITTKATQTKLDRIVKAFKQSLTDNLELVRLVLQERFAVVRCKVCNKEFNTPIFYAPICPSCQVKARSKQEEEISEFVRSLGFAPERNRKLLQASSTTFYEVDIFVPERRLGIEVNGLYFHKTLSYQQKDNNSVPRDYHIKKSLLARDQQIFLVHIWEDLWRDKQELVKSFIKAKLGLYDETIYARNCDVVILSFAEAQMFFEENHFHGAGKVPPIRYGLLYNQQIVSAIACHFVNGQLRISRFANKQGIQVIGGFSKLLDRVVRDVKPKLITTELYLDLNNMPEKSVYAQNGFRLVSNKPFETFYIYIHKLNQRKPRHHLMKHKVTEILKQLGLDEIAADIDNFTQSELADLLGGRIYTGYWKFEKVVN